MNSDRAVILILLIGEASGVFAGFCPSWFTVASPFFHEQNAKAGNIKRIRWGEIAAQHDPFPLLASALICVVFIAGYEYQIRNPSTNDSDSTPAVASSSWPTPWTA